MAVRLGEYRHLTAVAYKKPDLNIQCPRVGTWRPCILAWAWLFGMEPGQLVRLWRNPCPVFPIPRRKPRHRQAVGASLGHGGWLVVRRWSLLL